jgi:uncharacterized protein
MNLAKRINEEKIAAMKSKDVVRLSVLRAAETAITNQQKANSNNPLNDEEITAVLSKLYKQRIEASEAFTKAGYTQKAKDEHAESLVLEEFLPKKMTDAEVVSAVDTIVAELGAAGNPRMMGAIIGAFNKQYPNLADGKVVAQTVKTKLSV